MRPAARLSALALAAGLLLAPSVASTWGAAGHRMIGVLAVQALPDEVPAFVRVLPCGPPSPCAHGKRDMTKIPGAALAALLSLPASSASADVWDLQTDNDDVYQTDNELTHGTIQQHDLGAAGCTVRFAPCHQRAQLLGQGQRHGAAWRLLAHNQALRRRRRQHRRQQGCGDSHNHHRGGTHQRTPGDSNTPRRMPISLALRP